MRPRPPSLAVFAALMVLAGCSADAPSTQDQPHDTPEHLVEYDGGEGPGAGRHIVLVGGDEEYRSEEGLPALARMLSEHHGFRCTVLFAVDPETGIVNPHVNTNIPGTERLDDADLMFIQTRWRVLPAEQMEPIDRFLKAGKPVIAMRTATHAFAPTPELHKQVLAHLRNLRRAEDPEAVEPPEIPEDAWAPFDHYGDGYIGPKQEWRDGFGRLVVGERWVAHHGHHKHESARGVIVPEEAGHPILRGVPGDQIWSAADVYTVRLPLPGDSKPLVLGKVMVRAGEYDESDSLYGMRPTDSEEVAAKNDPMMPIAWTKTYQIPGGEQGRVFSTTLGSSTDLLEAGVRQMLMNAVFWALGEEESIPEEGVEDDLVGDFVPTRFNNHPPEYWLERAVKPADFR